MAAPLLALLVAVLAFAAVGLAPAVARASQDSLLLVAPHVDALPDAPAAQPFSAAQGSRIGARSDRSDITAAASAASREHVAAGSVAGAARQSAPLESASRAPGRAPPA